MRRFIIASVFALVINTLTPGQDHLNLQFKLAEDLYAAEKYFDAVTEFKRLIFFDSTNSFRTRAEYYIGVSYKKGGFFQEAIEHLTLAQMQNRDDEFSYRIRVEIIKSNILRRTVQKALRDIGELEAVINDKDKKTELKLLKGFAYAFSGQWETSSQLFREAGYPAVSDSIDRISGEMYSETKAAIFSAVIPGTGQIYTGNYLNGIISLGMNALTLYLTVNALAADRIFDGAAVGNFLWYRFYSGNISNAVQFVRQKNQQLENNALLMLQNFDEYRLD